MKQIEINGPDELQCYHVSINGAYVGWFFDPDYADAYEDNPPGDMSFFKRLLEAYKD